MQKYRRIQIKAGHWRQIKAGHWPLAASQSCSKSSATPFPPEPSTCTTSACNRSCTSGCMAKAHLSASTPPFRDFVTRATMVMAVIVGNGINRTASGGRRQCPAGHWRRQHTTQARGWMNIIYNPCGGSAQPATGGSRIPPVREDGRMNLVIRLSSMISGSRAASTPTSTDNKILVQEQARAKVPGHWQVDRKKTQGFLQPGHLKAT